MSRYTRIMLRLSVIFVASITTTTVRADITLPALISDNMVLQQDSNITLWGWADPGETVSLSASWNVSAKTVADHQGQWKMTIRTPKADDSPRTLTFHGASNTLKVSNILIGEVWVCSGQSNMEFRLEQGDEKTKAAGRDVSTTIRLFDVENRTAMAPQEDCKGVWKVCTPETAAKFSAVGFIFGKDLNAKLNVPIGLIESDWGGTAAEAWTSAAGLAPLHDFDAALAMVQRVSKDSDKIESQFRESLANWYKSLPRTDAGSTALPAWSDPAYDDSSWETMKVPSTWSGAYANFDGFGWYRTTFDLPADWDSTNKGDATLTLGPIDDCDTTWINGRIVGNEMRDGVWFMPRKYPVPASLLKQTGNIIAVRVLDTAVVGGFSGQPEDVKLVSSSGQTVPLAGLWKFRIGAAMSTFPPKPMNVNNPWTPTSLFNGMIAPLVNYHIRGAIWYQGEANVGRAEQYRKLLPALIGDWREHWGIGDFPFGIVQIAPFGYGGNRPEQAARLREAELLTAQNVPNCGMASTMDIGNTFNIHPTDKLDVGNRLSLWALDTVYHAPGVRYDGPMYQSMKIEDHAIRLMFDGGAGLHTTDDRDPQGFTIAGADRKFVPATKVAIEGSTIVISAASISDPLAVRYCWGAADESNLKNGLGLPPSSFRTDDWPEVVEP